jgi:uncharacterized damage-inducible protein DinB
MTKIERIIDELTRALEHDPWHGPSICEVIQDVTAAEAAAHPVAGAHSIWELVHHVTAWVRAIHLRVTGKSCELEGEADWPPVRDAKDAAWSAALEDLRRAQSDLLTTLRNMRDADLLAVTPGRDYDLEHLLDGLIQHHAYHTGQIALIRNASRAASSGRER